MALPSDDGAGRPDSDLEPRRRVPESGEEDDAFVVDEEHEAAPAPAFFPPSNNFPTALESTSRLILLPSRPPSRAKVRSLIVLCACVVGMLALVRSPDVSGMEAEMSDAEVLAVVPPSAAEMDTRALIDPAQDAVEAAMVGHQRVSSNPEMGMETRALIEPAVEVAPMTEPQQQEVEVLEQPEAAQIQMPAVDEQQPEADQVPAVDESRGFAPQAQEPAMPARQQGDSAGFQGRGSAVPRNGPGAGQVPNQGGNGVPGGPRPDFSGQGRPQQQGGPGPDQEPWGDVPSRAEPYLARLRNHPVDQLQQQQQANPTRSQQPRGDDLTPEEREQRREKFRKQQEKLVEQTKRIEDLRVVQERAREEKILEKLGGKKKSMVEDVEVSAEQVQEVPSREEEQVQGREEEVPASEQVEENEVPQVQPQLRAIAIESDEAAMPSPEAFVSDEAPPSLEGPVATQAGGFRVNYDEVMNRAGVLSSPGAFAVVSCLLLTYLA